MLATAKKYKTVKEWRKKDVSSYIYCYPKYGAAFAKKCKAHMSDARRLWWNAQPEDTLRIARTYNTRSEWKISHERSYRYALRRPELFIECVLHMRRVIVNFMDVKHLPTGKVYPSIRAAARATGYGKSRVHEILVGQSKKPVFEYKLKQGAY